MSTFRPALDIIWQEIKHHEEEAHRSYSDYERGFLAGLRHIKNIYRALDRYEEEQKPDPNIEPPEYDIVSEGFGNPYK